MVQKVKLGHSNLVLNRVLRFRKISTWVGFNYPYRLGPRETDLHAPLVPKAKLGHSNCMYHWVLIFRKLSTWFRFNYPSRLGPKDTEPCAPLVPMVKLGHSNCMHYQVLIIQEVNLLGWVQLSFKVRPKRHGTACAFGPKGEARTHGLHVTSVPKAKLGLLSHVYHWVLILRKLSTWLGFKYFSRLDPKDTEPHAPSVPKVKLGHTDRVPHRSQRQS